MLLWLNAFLFTQAVEVPIYLYALPRERWAILVAFGASALTHPLVWYFFPVLFDYWEPQGFLMMAIFAEAFAVFAEAMWLSRFQVKHAFLWAFVANMSSVGLGKLSRYFFDWPVEQHVQGDANHPGPGDHAGRARGAGSIGDADFADLRRQPDTGSRGHRHRRSLLRGRSGRHGPRRHALLHG